MTYSWICRRCTAHNAHAFKSSVNPNVACQDLTQMVRTSWKRLQARYGSNALLSRVSKFTSFG